jgi:hypothetical protein
MQHSDEWELRAMVGAEFFIYMRSAQPSTVIDGLFNVKPYSFDMKEDVTHQKVNIFIS